MITIKYTNGNVQNITPGGSFYATVVEKRRGNRYVQVKLEPSEWRKNILDIAEDIAIDCSHFSYRGCPVEKITVYFPQGEIKSQIRVFSFPAKEELIPSSKSYKNEQKRLRKLHKNDPKPKTFMRFGIID